MLFKASWRLRRPGRRQVLGRWTAVHYFAEPPKPYQPGTLSQMALCGTDIPEAAKYVTLATGEAAQGHLCKRCEKISKLEKVKG